MQETQGDRIIDYFYDSNCQAVALKYRANAAATGVYYYYAYNSRGDIIGLYDANGTKYCTYSYDPWGNILSVKNANGGNISSDTIAYYQSLRYRGYVYDTETGFYYLQSRYYDPVTRRFINADGLVSTDTGILGNNIFAYCGNNSVIHSDRSGTRYDDFFVSSITRMQKRAARSKKTSEKRFPKKTEPILIKYNNAYVVGNSVSVGFFAYLGLSKGLAFDHEGNVAVINTISIGRATPDLSASGFMSLTNAKNVYELEGLSKQFGFSGDADGVSVGGDISWSDNGIVQTGPSAGAGFSPAEYHYGYSYSYISSSIDFKRFRLSDCISFYIDSSSFIVDAFSLIP